MSSLSLPHQCRIGREPLDYAVTIELEHARPICAVGEDLDFQNSGTGCHGFSPLQLVPMFAGPEGGPSSDMQRYEG